MQQGPGRGPRPGADHPSAPGWYGTAAPGAAPLPPWERVLLSVTPVRRLGVAVLVLGAVYTAVTLLGAVLAFPAADQLAAAPDVLLLLTGYETVAALTFPLLVALWVVASIWTSRVRRNALVISPHVPHARGEAWAWLGWIVPVVSFWFPYQVVRDTARGSRVDSGLALGWWWASWLACTIVGGVTANLIPFEGPAGPELALLGPLELLRAVLTVVSFALWVRVVSRLGRAQEASAALR